jgi:integrase
VQGIDPGSLRMQQAAEKPALTFRVLAETYIKKRVRALRRGAAAEREVRQLIDRWGKLPVPDLTRTEVVAFVEELGARSPSMAHRLFAHLRALFNWARERGTVEASPCDMIRPGKLTGSLEPRQRTLTDAEVRAFWIATGTIPYPHGPLHRLVLLTGARLREVADARWTEFDLTEKVWNVPPERNKSRANHIVPLSDETLALIAALPRYRYCPFLFTADERNAVRNMHTPKAKIDAGMAKVLGRKLTPWVVHDLRRVVRSRLAEMGIREEVAERVLGHGAKDKIVRTYNTYNYLPEVRDALQRWGEVVGKLGG